MQWIVAVLLIAGAFACHSGEPATKAESIRQGDEFVSKKQYAKAVAAYRSAVRQDEADGIVHLKLAKTYMLAGNWRLGPPEAVRAADLLPTNGEAQTLAMNLLYQSQQFPEAERRARSMLGEQPNNVDALVALGNSKARLFSSALALSKVDEAVRNGANVEAARLSIRPTVLARDDEVAETSLRRAVAIDPTSRYATMSLANFLWAAGRWSESEEPLRVLAQRAPSDVFVNRVLGRLYLLLRREADAELWFQKAIQLGDPAARLALADLYMATNRDDRAVSLLNATTAADDVKGDVTLRLAPLEFRQGRREQAMHRIDALLARAKDNNRAVILKAQLLTAAGTLDQALRLAGEAVARDPKSSEALATLGDARFKAGDLDKAFDDYSEALKLDPESSALPLKLARLSLALGRNATAARHASDALRKNPDSREAAVALVQALVAVGDYESADREVQPLLKRYPDAADVLAQAGAVHLGRGDPQAARITYTRALQLDPALGEAVAGLVAVDLRQDRRADARARVERLLATYPRDAGYLVLAANVFIASDDAARAEAALRRALAVDPANERAALELSDQLARGQRLAEAKRVLEEVLERRPRSLDVQTAIGMRLEQMAQPAEARAYYEKIVAQDPGAAKAATRLAALYVAEGDNLDVALTLAASAKQHLPNDPAVNDVLGWVFARKNLPALALPHLHDAVRAVPTSAQYRFHLASALLQAGQVPSAREQFTRALKIDPNFAEASQARKALASISK